MRSSLEDYKLRKAIREAEGAVLELEILKASYITREDAKRSERWIANRVADAIQAELNRQLTQAQSPISPNAARFMGNAASAEGRRVLGEIQENVERFGVKWLIHQADIADGRLPPGTPFPVSN